MNWQILALISVLSNSVGNLISKKIVSDENSYPITFTMLYQITGGAMVLLIGILQQTISIPSIVTLEMILSFIAMAVLYSVGCVFIYTALKEIELSQYSTLSISSSVFTVLSASIFLKEALSYKQVLGFLVIFLSFLVLNINSEDRKKAFINLFRLNKFSIYALLGAMCFGIGITSDSYLYKPL